MPPSISPQQFVAKWRGDTRKERSISQEHFIASRATTKIARNMRH